MMDQAMDMTRKLSFTRHDGTLAQVVVLSSTGSQAMTIAFGPENFTFTMDGSVIIGSRGLEVILPDPDYAGYGAVGLQITGTCMLDAVQIKMMQPHTYSRGYTNETNIVGADLTNVSFDGMIDCKAAQLRDVSVKQPRELKRSNEALVLATGVYARNCYIKHHVGSNTQLGNNVNVSAPIGQNLIIPDNRAVYKPIDGAAAPTVVDDDMLELLDALKDMEEVL